MTDEERMPVPGEPDPKPYKVDLVTKDGALVKQVAEYATEQEALAHERRADWHYRIHSRRGGTLWPRSG